MKKKVAIGIGILLLVIVVVVVIVLVKRGIRPKNNASMHKAEMTSITRTTVRTTDKATINEITITEEEETTTEATTTAEEEPTTTEATTTTKALPEVIISQITTRTTNNVTNVVTTTMPTTETTTTTPTTTTTTTTTTESSSTKVDPNNIEEVTKMSYGELQGIILSNFDEPNNLELWIVDGIYYLNGKVVVFSSTKNVGEEQETALGMGIVVSSWEQPGYVIVESDDVG